MLFGAYYLFWAREADEKVSFDLPDDRFLVECRYQILISWNVTLSRVR